MRVEMLMDLLEKTRVAKRARNKVLWETIFAADGGIRGRLGQKKFFILSRGVRRYIFVAGLG